MAEQRNTNLVSVNFPTLTTFIMAMNSKIDGVLDSLEKYSTSYSSTTIVPSHEPEVLDNKIDSTIILLNKLKTELYAFETIGESIKDLDKFLGREAMLLNYEVNDSNLSEVPELYIGENDNPEFSDDTKYMVNKYDNLLANGIIGVDDNTESGGE